MLFRKRDRSGSGPTRQEGSRPRSIVIAAKGLPASRAEPRRRRPRAAGAAGAAHTHYRTTPGGMPALSLCMLGLILTVGWPTAPAEAPFAGRSMGATHLTATIAQSIARRD